MDAIETTCRRIKENSIIAILRGNYTVDDLRRIGDALLSGTVAAMELTLNSPSALVMLPKLRQHFGDAMLIGAGTVRNASQAQQAIMAGAQFMVSPNFDPETVSVACAQDVLHLPGVLTPTEAQNAFAAGARMLKLFPMDFFGPAYLKILRGPLDNIDFVPTGGISLENIGAYARAGASAVGLGSQLVSDPAQIVSRALALRQAWMQAKNA